MTTSTEKFIAEAQQRLAPFFAEAQQRLDRHKHGSEAHKAELGKIEAELQPLIDAEIAEHGTQAEARVAGLRADYARIRGEHEARAIIAAIARPGSADVLLPHLLERVVVEQRGEEWIVGAKDASGRPTSLDALREEFRSNPVFAPVIRGTSAEEEVLHARQLAEWLGEAPDARAKRYTRAEFEQLSDEARSAAIAGGARVVDH